VLFVSQFAIAMTLLVLSALSTKNFRPGLERSWAASTNWGESFERSRWLVTIAGFAKDKA